MDQKLYSIGELSKLCNVTDRTLRYYDKINLLKPSYIDPDNNYRYYSAKDILVINIVKKMKYNGFKLDDIKMMLIDNSLEILEKIYNRKKEEMASQILKLEKMKKRIDTRLDVFKNIFCNYLNFVRGENTKKNDEINFVEKPVRKIAFLRSTIEFSIENLLLKCTKFMDNLFRYDIDVEEPYMAIYHVDFKNMDIKNTDVEICAYLKSHKINPRFKNIRELVGGTYACSVVKGNFENTKEKTLAMIDVLTKGGFQITGDILRVYLFGIEHARTTEKYITEIQIPVKKI